MSGQDREEPCDAVALPASLTDGVQGYQWARDRAGQSGGAVYRLYGRADAPDLFLKHGRGAAADDVTDEMVRLRWLADYIPVPAVVHFVRTREEAWLLMTKMPGKTAFQILAADCDAGAEIVDALAEFLRRLHAIPIDACPFNSGHAFRLGRARARIDAGVIDVDDFDPERAGWTAEKVWRAAHALLPFPPDPVVTHGDFSLDNLLIREGRVSGCIDVGRAGIADRYQDLAILWNGLCEFGDPLSARLFDRYHIDTPDERKLRFHLLLDELF